MSFYKSGGRCLSYLEHLWHPLLFIVDIAKQNLDFSEGICKNDHVIISVWEGGELTVDGRYCFDARNSLITPC